MLMLYGVFVFCSAQSELMPYAEVVNGMLVQVLNSTSTVGDKEQGQRRPLRFSVSCDIVAACHYNSCSFFRQTDAHLVASFLGQPA